MGFVKIGKLEDVAPGTVKVYQLPGREIAVCNAGGRLYAIDNICTHEFACLTDGFIEDDEVECPLHQARFQIRTGKAMSAPATEDLRTYSVIRMEDGIFVNVEA